MAMSVVSYIVIRILQSFEKMEPVIAPASQDPNRNPVHWPSEATRYDMEDIETTFKLGLTMNARAGVFVNLRPATATATKSAILSETKSARAPANQLTNCVGSRGGKSRA